MSNITVRKSLLENHLFSDNLNFWIIEAISFKKAADILRQTEIIRESGAKFVSMTQVSEYHHTIKISCFLYSISVELFLKAIYVKNRTNFDQEKTESFGHKVKDIYKKLISIGVFKNGDISEELLNSVFVILNWYGRYYRPNERNIDDVIATCFESTEDDCEMLKPKFSTDQKTADDLRNLCEFLNNFSGSVSPSSIDFLLSTPC